MACFCSRCSKRRDYQRIRDEERVGCCGREPELTIKEWQTAIYFYIHMYSVSKINIAEQCFDAYYYFRATWTVKEMKTFSEPRNNFEKLGVEKPLIVFINALSKIEISEESVDWSKYRGHQQGKVVEWKGLVRGTFRFKFDPCDFPFDSQLLTIIMSATEPKWILCEDVYGLNKAMCRSEIRAEFHSEPGYRLGAGNESLCFLKDTADIPTTWHNRRGQKTHLLAMGVLIERANCCSYLTAVAIPCFLIGAAEVIVVAADTLTSEQRLSLTVVNMVLLLLSIIRARRKLPAIGTATATTLCERSFYLASSFVMAALVLLILESNDDTRRIRALELLFCTAYGFLLLAWCWVGCCGCRRMRSVHAKAAQKTEDMATIDLKPAFEKRRCCESCCGTAEEDPELTFPYTNPEFPGFVSLFSLPVSRADEGGTKEAKAPPPLAAPPTAAPDQDKPVQSSEEEKKQPASETSTKLKEVDEQQQHMSAPSTLFNKLSFGRKTSSAGSKGGSAT